MGLFREAILDEHGLVDVVNLAFYYVTALVLGAITFVCAMALWDYARCKTACHFDPLPIGQAVGLICGGYSTALLAVSAYMAATRPPRYAAPPTSSAAP